MTHQTFPRRHQTYVLWTDCEYEQFLSASGVRSADSTAEWAIIHHIVSYLINLSMSLLRSQVIPTSSIRVMVSSPTKVGSGIQSYVQYAVTTSTSLDVFPEKECSVVRRYSDFEWLHERVCTKYPGQVCIFCVCFCCIMRFVCWIRLISFRVRALFSATSFASKQAYHGKYGRFFY